MAEPGAITADQEMQLPAVVTTAAARAKKLKDRSVAQTVFEIATSVAAAAAAAFAAANKSATRPLAIATVVLLLVLLLRRLFRFAVPLQPWQPMHAAVGNMSEECWLFTTGLPPYDDLPPRGVPDPGVHLLEARLRQLAAERGLGLPAPPGDDLTPSAGMTTTRHAAARVRVASYQARIETQQRQCNVDADRFHAWHAAWSAVFVVAGIATALLATLVLSNGTPVAAMGATAALATGARGWLSAQQYQARESQARELGHRLGVLQTEAGDAFVNRSTRELHVVVHSVETLLRWADPDVRSFSIVDTTPMAIGDQDKTLA